MGSLTNAGLFLINVVFSFYMALVILRIIMQKMNVDYYNPIAQFVIKLTQIPLKFLRRFIPGFKGYDLAAVVLLLFLALIKILLACLLVYAFFPYFFGWLLWAIADALRLVVNVFFYAILLQAILSWFTANRETPLAPILYVLTEPLLKYARRFIPLIGGIDISPIPVLIILQLLLIILVYPLLNYGKLLALS